MASATAHDADRPLHQAWGSLRPAHLLMPYPRLAQAGTSAHVAENARSLLPLCTTPRCLLLAQGSQPSACSSASLTTTSVSEQLDACSIASRWLYSPQCSCGRSRLSDKHHLARSWQASLALSSFASTLRPTLAHHVAQSPLDATVADGSTTRG